MDEIYQPFQQDKHKKEINRRFNIITQKNISTTDRILFILKVTDNTMKTEDFKIVRLLGKGTYGAVYKVIKKSDKEEYAMKEVSIKNLKTREQEDAVNEIRVLASIKHRNILRYCDAFLEKKKKNTNF